MIVLAAAVFPVFMRIWVGRGFAEHAAPIGVILLVGIWINGLAYVPYGHLQAKGRPDIVAKFHAIEVIPFLGILWLGLHSLGLIGAAYAWTLRTTVDALLLFIVGGSIPRWRRLLPGGLIVVLAAVLSPTLVMSARMLAETVLMIVATVWSWNLSPIIRAAIRQRLGVRNAHAAA